MADCALDASFLPDFPQCRLRKVFAGLSNGAHSGHLETGRRWVLNWGTKVAQGMTSRVPAGSTHRSWYVPELMSITCHAER